MRERVQNVIPGRCKWSRKDGWPEVIRNDVSGTQGESSTAMKADGHYFSYLSKNDGVHALCN